LYAVHVRQVDGRSSMHIQQKELNACIGKLRMCSRAEVHRSCELTVYWNVLEPEMIILTRMRGKKYQFQTMRSHLAFPRDLKLKDLQSVQLSMNMIQEIIEEMRTEHFQFRPVRTVFIPKSNGKMRKLGIPSTRDKIVQEVIRTILECIYDSPHGPYFHETSHGFRPNRSCHTALREIRGKWPAINWFLEGDIAKCFDAIDHRVLVTLLRRKIQDERFLNLLWKLLRAGYLDLREARHDSLAGTPQGGLASPILANVYLHELDQAARSAGKNESLVRTRLP